MRSPHVRRGVAGGLRRRLGSAVAIAIVATSASLARPTPAAAECSSVPITDSSAGVGPLGPAGFIGDSTGMGMIQLGAIVDQLRTAGWGPVRASAICGGRTTGSGSFSALTTVAGWRRSGFEPQLWVIGLGSNDVGFCEDRVAECRAGIDGVLAAIGGEGHVVWQNISHPRRTWEAAWNQALGGAEAAHPLMDVADWVSAVNANPALVTWDRVHAADPAAYRVRARIAVDAGNLWRQSNTTTTTPGAPTAVGDPAAFGPLASPQRAVDTRSGVGGRRLGAGATLTVDLAGVVPADASAAAVNLTVDGASGPGYLSAWACGGPAPTVSSLNFAARAPRAAHAVVTLASGRFCVTSPVATDVVVDVFGSYGPTGTLRYNPSSPVRLLDTRTTGARTLVRAGSVTEVVVPSAGGAAPLAAALNVTATDATAPGYVAVYPCGGAVPTVSSLNVDGAAPRANLVQVATTSGRVCLYNLAATHLVVDLAGTYGTTGLRYQAAAAQRVLDTRVGTGGWLGAAGAFQPVALTVPAGAAGVTYTLTVAAPGGSGYLTAHPCGEAPPTASNLNYADGETAANAAMTGATPCVVTKGRAHVVADVTGWWVA